MPRARLALLASLALLVSLVSLAYTLRARYLTWLNVPAGRDGAKSDTALSAFGLHEKFHADKSVALDELPNCEAGAST